MSPRAWRWGFLAVAVAVLSGCTSALNGAAVAPSGPPVTVVEVPTKGLAAHQFGGKSNLLPNGSFTASTAPWRPTAHAGIAWVKNPHRFGKTALLARPISFKPFGARVGLAGAPAAHTRFTLSGWVRGNRGNEVIAQLYESHGSKTVVIGTTTQTLTGRWQRISVQGLVKRAGITLVSGGIYVATGISRTSWLAIDGVKATEKNERPGG